MSRTEIFSQAKELSIEHDIPLLIQWANGTKIQWNDELERIQNIIEVRKIEREIEERKQKLSEIFKEAAERARLIKQRKLAILEAIELAKLQQKLFNVTVEAEYKVGKDQILRKITLQFSVQAFDDGEIRRNIDFYRIQWEDDKNGILFGNSKWTFNKYISILILNIDDNDLLFVPMFGACWNYKLLGDIDIININKSDCVVDYLLYEFSKCEYYFRKMNKNKIIKLLGGKKDGYCVMDIVYLAKTSNYISVHALSPLLEVFNHYKSKHDSKINLCFIVNNNHCYPIIDKTFKSQIIYTKKLKLDLFVFNVKYEDYSYFDSELEFNNTFDEKTHEKVCLVNTSNLFLVANLVMYQSKYLIQGMKFSDGILKAFEHPNGHIIQSVDEYNLKLLVCNQLYQTIKIDEFRFHNQSWANIAKTLYQIKFNNLKQSTLSSQLSDIYKSYPVGPYIKQITIDTSFDKNTHKGFDICKSYTDVILNNKDNYAIFTSFDQVKSTFELKEYAEWDEWIINWVTGEYYINKRFYLANKSIVMDKGFYPLNFVKYCFNKKYINIDSITHYIKSGYCLKYDHFKKFVNYVLENFDSLVSKILINYFIGFLNTKYSKIEKGAITDSYEIACGTFGEENKKINTTCFISKLNELFIINSTKREVKSQNSMPIWRHIVCGGIINLDKMYNLVADENSIIIGIKVDAIFIKNPNPKFIPKTENNKKIGDITEESWSISGTMINIDSRLSFKEDNKGWIKVDYNHTEEEFNIIKNGSYLINGISGSCKSFTLSKLYKISKKKIIVLCFTNKSVSVLKKKGVKLVQTFDSIFYSKNKDDRDENNIYKLNNYNEIWIDEYAMVPWRLLSMLSKLKSNGKVIRLFGDHMQTSPIEKCGDGSYTKYKMYDYTKSQFIMKLCDYRWYEMKYISKYGRYDDDLYNAIMILINKDRISNEFKKQPIDMKLLTHIAYTNKKCISINNISIENHELSNPNYIKVTYILNKKDMKNKEKYYDWTNEKTIVKWMKGIPVICNVNSKEYKINKGELHIIESVGTMIKIVDGKEFDLEYFSKNFSIGFCVTVHRMQGDEIQNDYNIHEAWMMSKELLYTAMGRGRRFKNVHIEWNNTKYISEQIYTDSTILDSKPKKYIENEMKDKNDETQYKKKEPKIQIIQKVQLNKLGYEINELNDMYIIQYRINGKKKNRKVRFGKRTNKKDAYEKIKKIQHDLRNEII